MANLYNSSKEGVDTTDVLSFTTKPAAVLGKARQNMLVLSMPTNLWEYDWKEYRKGIMKITSLQKEWIHWVIIIWCTSLFQMRHARKKADAKVAVEKNGKIGKESSMAADESQKQ